MASQPAPPQPETMSATELAARIGNISADYVYDRVRDKEWPCTRLGRKVRFTEADLADILRICRVDPVRRSTKKRSA